MSEFDQAAPPVELEGEPAVASINEIPSANGQASHQRPLRHVSAAITGEPWAIIPSELYKISAIVQRHSLDAAAKHDGAPEYIKRDYQVMAGPGAQRIPGTNRAFMLDGVAVIPVTGAIFPRANMMTELSGATSISTLTDDYRRAIDNSEVGAVILMLDSPGGAVSGVNSFADAIVAGKKKKYTMAFVAGAAASAAYWIASSASEVVIERTGMVGSIGVVAALPTQVAPDSSGEMWIEIVSSNAPNKRPDPLSEDGRGEVVSMLDAIEAQFISDVARGRGITSEKVKSDFGQGGLKVGSDAVKAGMADKVQSYDAALSRMKSMVANQRKLTALKRA